MDTQAAGEHKPSIMISIEPRSAGLYYTGVSFNSPLTPDQAKAAKNRRRYDMLGFVLKDVKLYISAAGSGFESFKGSPYMTVDKLGAWKSTEQPFLSEGCAIVELAAKNNVFVCALDRSPYEGEILNQYNELLENVGFSLPGDWVKNKEEPSNDQIASASFRSARSRLEAWIWLCKYPNQQYGIRYTLSKRE